MNLSWIVPEVTHGEIQGYEFRITIEPLAPESDSAENDELIVFTDFIEVS